MTDNNLFTIIPYQNDLLKFSEAKSARAYFKNSYIDLLTGKTHDLKIEEWINSLEFRLIDYKNDLRVIHLFYELGFIFENLSNDVLSNEMLGIDIEYTKKEDYELLTNTKKISLTTISSPTFCEYKKKFEAGYRELTEGNCYQFNLTEEFNYSFSSDIVAEDFIAALWRDKKFRGPYATATYTKHLDKLFLSNSPECLFQYSKGIFFSRPIKGTLKRVTSKKQETSKLWRELVNDRKSAGELNMITDLLRNDLCKIDLPRAVVTKLRAPLLVPGLLHQYSEIKIKLRPHVTLKKILENIFPGGSITGAPKRRVMMILKTLESRTRGFYCGSTIIFFQNTTAASINIRSSVVDFEQSILSYQAGGGITLLSDAKMEFDELTYKHDSYIDILTL